MNTCEVNVTARKNDVTSIRRRSSVEEPHVVEAPKEQLDDFNRNEKNEVDWETVAIMLDVFLFYVNLIAVALINIIFTVFFFTR